MEITLDKINQRTNPYQLFLDSIKSPDTARKYKKALQKFLMAIPTKVYQDTIGKVPQDTGPITLASIFVELARKDPDLVHNIIAAFIKEEKKIVEEGKLSPNSIPNHIKPIKVLLDSNKIPLHWKSLYGLYPRKQDEFKIKVWSDSDPKGIILLMKETGENTGIFQGIVNFKNDKSSGNALIVVEGDSVTAEYIDRTLPSPFTSNDQLRLTATTFIGSTVPPLERLSILNSRLIDPFDNTITSGTVDQEIRITSDLINEQDHDQPFAYLVQIQDSNGVTISLRHTEGKIRSNHSNSVMSNWIPSAPGIYTIQIFLWQSVNNPNALAPPLTFRIKIV